MGDKQTASAFHLFKTIAFDYDAPKLFVFFKLERYSKETNMHPRVACKVSSVCRFVQSIMLHNVFPYPVTFIKSKTFNRGV